jgi:colanic acid biosynthesis protein WcaH
VGRRFPAGQSPIGSQPEKVWFEIGGGLVYHQLMTAPRFPGDDDFARIIRHAALVSIDIVVKDPEGNVLLGLRVNEPARGQYFVPGGVIRKNERIRDAFSRILKVEIGIEASLNEAKFLGAFEHFYETNRFGNPEYGTHYVVLAYEINLDQRPTVETDLQHSDTRWMSEAEILSAEDVHPNTKAYFSLDGSTARP